MGILNLRTMTLMAALSPAGAPAQGAQFSRPSQSEAERAVRLFLSEPFNSRNDAVNLHPALRPPYPGITVRPHDRDGDSLPDQWIVGFSVDSRDGPRKILDPANGFLVDTTTFSLEPNPSDPGGRVLVASPEAYCHGPVNSAVCKWFLPRIREWANERLSANRRGVESFVRAFVRPQQELGAIQVLSREDFDRLQREEEALPAHILLLAILSFLGVAAFAMAMLQTGIGLVTRPRERRLVTSRRLSFPPPAPPMHADFFTTGPAAPSLLIQVTRGQTGTGEYAGTVGGGNGIGVIHDKCGNLQLLVVDARGDNATAEMATERLCWRTLDEGDARSGMRGADEVVQSFNASPPLPRKNAGAVVVGAEIRSGRVQFNWVGDPTGMVFRRSLDGHLTWRYSTAEDFEVTTNGEIVAIPLGFHPTVRGTTDGIIADPDSPSEVRPADELSDGLTLERDDLVLLGAADFWTSLGNHPTFLERLEGCRTADDVVRAVIAETPPGRQVPSVLAYLHHGEG